MIEMSVLKEIVKGWWGDLEPASWFSAWHYKITTTIFAIFVVTIQGSHFSDPFSCAPFMKIGNNQDRFCWDSGFLRTFEGLGLDHYKWIPLGLVYLTIAFYLPHCVGKTFRKIEPLKEAKEIIKNTCSLSCSATERIENMNILVEYLIEELNNWNKYAFWLYVEHLLNMLNVIAQFFVLNWFFGTTDLNIDNVTTKVRIFFQLYFILYRLVY